MKITYEINTPGNFAIEERALFLELLRQQKKVVNPTISRVNRCSLLGFCKVDGRVTSIGAVKPGTESDFAATRANLPNLVKSFSREIGYCYTVPDHTRKGYSSGLVKILIRATGDFKLMATTEIDSKNPMLRILESNGFRQFGNVWRSQLHEGVLGLFLRF